MHFAFPELSWLSATAAAIALLAGIGLLRKRCGLRRLLANPGAHGDLLLVRRSLQFLKVGLVTGAAALLAVAILGPQWGQNTVEAGPAPGRDVLILLDVSRSMQARDVSPSRLERAKADIRDLLASLKKKGGYRVGLIVFADRAALLCPLTSDYRAFEEELGRASLNALRMRKEPIVRDGTQVGLALDRAGRAIREESTAYTDLLLISDGGDMDQATQAAAAKLASAGIQVHTLGLGDPGQGALIPVEGPNGIETFLTHKGEPVRVTLEEQVLREVAQQTGGQYLAVGTGFLELDRWYETMIAGKHSRDLAASGPSQVWIHRFQWFLAPALLLLLLEMLVGDGRRKVGTVRHVPFYYTSIRRRSRKTASERQPV